MGASEHRYMLGTLHVGCGGLLAVEVWLPCRCREGPPCFELVTAALPCVIITEAAITLATVAVATARGCARAAARVPASDVGVVAVAAAVAHDDARGATEYSLPNLARLPIPYA